MLESVDFNSSEQYNLSIRLSADGFYFALTSNSEEERTSMYIHKIDETLSMTANMKHAFTELEWLGNQFNEVSAVIQSTRFTIIPLEFFEDEQATTIFNHNLGRQDNETILYDILHNSNDVILFGVDKSLCQLLKEKFGEITIHSQAAIITDYFTKDYHNGKTLSCFVNKSSIIVVATNIEKILLVNSFICESTEDRLYYILYCWKQLGFNQIEDTFFITGSNIEMRLLEELRKYLKFVKVASNSQEYIDLINCAKS